MRTVRWCRAAAGAAAVVLVLGGAAGCSSGDAGAGASVPQYSPDDDGGGGASAGASGAASGSAAPTALTWAPQDVTPEGLSNPDTEYTVVNIPEGLDDTGKEVVAAYVAYDRSTWEAYRVMDGDLSRVEASTTGDLLASYKSSYERYRTNGWHAEGQYSVTIVTADAGDAEKDEDALLFVCADQRQVRVVNDSGEPGRDVAHTYRSVVTVTRVSGVWMVSRDDEVGVDQC